jgi:hypothetical protein
MEFHAAQLALFPLMLYQGQDLQHPGVHLSNASVFLFSFISLPLVLCNFFMLCFGRINSTYGVHLQNGPT